MANFFIKIFVTIIAGIYSIFGVTVGSVDTNDVDALADGADIRVVSYNVKSLKWTNMSGDENFYTTSVRLAAELLELDADSIGLQEVTYDRLVLFDKYLDGYSYVGESRGSDEPEYNLIYYKTDKYNVLDYGTFWLSDTPNTESAFENSRCYRICTWVLLENKETGECYVHANTHLDHSTIAAVRVNQFTVLIEQLEELGLLDYPLVLTGDFNMGNTDTISDLMTSAGLTNSRLTATVTDSSTTWNDWGTYTDVNIIDYALVNSGFTPVVYKVVSSYIDGKWASDHNAIYVDLSFS